MSDKSRTAIRAREAARADAYQKSTAPKGATKAQKAKFDALDESVDKAVEKVNKGK